MPEIQPPAFVQEGCHTAQGLRLMWDSIICQPGAGRGSFGLSVGDGMEVVVAPGQGWVQGDQVDRQGVYHVASDSAVTVPVSAADPTDDRIDLVVARVYDEQYSGTTSEWHIEVVEGTPSPAPVAPDAPPNSIVLGRVVVPAGAIEPTVDTSGRELFRLCNTDPDPIGLWTRAEFPTQHGQIHSPGGWVTEYSFGGIEYVANDVWRVPEPGWYEIHARLQFVTNTNGLRDLWIAGRPQLTTWPVSGGIARLSASRVVRVEQSDDMVIEDLFQLRQTSGGNLEANNLEVLIKRYAHGW